MTPGTSAEVEPSTLPACLRAFAQRWPDRVALREKRLGIWHEVTWRDYWSAVVRAGRRLEALGVQAGDHVAILSDNRPEWLYADLGAQLLGARAVGIYQTNPPEDVAYVLSHSGAKVLICEDQEQVDKAVEVAAATPSVAHVVVIDPRGTRGYEDQRLKTWDAFVGAALPADADSDAGWADEKLARLDPSAPSMVVYTSGTTGPPKGALLSSRNALFGARAMRPLLGITSRDTLLSYLPLCHVAEKVFSLFIPLTTGAVVHFGESIDTVRDDLREVAPTVFLGVPRIWEKLHASVTLKMKDASWIKRRLFQRYGNARVTIARRRFDGDRRAWDRVTWWLGDLLVFRALRQRLGLGRCVYPVTGAAPLSAELIAWFHAIGVPVAEGYGMTECAGVSHINLPGEERLGFVGVVLPGSEHRLAEDGEILVRGDHVFCGYLHNDEATRAAIDDEGWLHTGDIGQIDGDHLRITGRKKELIITAGGKNLSPEKIEHALKLSPYVKEAVAIGDRRKFISALVQIDGDAVGDWANRAKLAYTSYEDLAGKPQVHKLVAEAVKAANEHLARVEQVRAFRILPKELHQDDGELTATQKVRRREVVSKFTALVESMYGGSV